MGLLGRNYPLAEQGGIPCQIVTKPTCDGFVTLNCFILASYPF